MYKTREQIAKELLLPMNRDCNCGGSADQTDHAPDCNYILARDRAWELAQVEMDEENLRNEEAAKLRGQPSLTYWWDPEAQHPQCSEKGAWVLEIGDEVHGRRFIAMVEPSVCTPQVDRIV